MINKKQKQELNQKQKEKNPKKTISLSAKKQK